MREWKKEGQWEGIKCVGHVDQMLLFYTQFYGLAKDKTSESQSMAMIMRLFNQE